MDTEILVIGGGPAGVLAAYTAATAGAKVILVDTKERSDIGNKTCGDAIALKPLLFLEENLDLSLPQGQEVCSEVSSLLFQTDNGDMTFGGAGFILDRYAYGQRLLKMAEQAGVEVRDKTRALSARYSDGSVIGARIKNVTSGEEYDINALITIDCSGRNYIIRKTLPPSDFPLLESVIDKSDICPSFREIIKLKDGIPVLPSADQPLIIFRDDIPQPGYFWFFFKGGQRLNVGTGWLMTTPTPKSMKKIYREVLHQYYSPDQYTVEDSGGYTIPLRYPIGNAVAKGFLTAGDAACHVTPLTAEGHAPALIAGYYAGKIAVEAIKLGDVSEKTLWPYNQFVMSHFGKFHAQVQILQEALMKFGTERFDFVLRRKVVTRKDYNVLKYGEKLGLTSIVMKALRTFPRFHYLPKIYKMARKSSQVSKLFKEYPSGPENYPEWNERYLTLMESLKNL